MLNFTARVHVGLKRTNQEDCFITRPDIGLFAVADGIGGHAAGEVASYLACSKFAEYVTEKEANNIETYLDVALSGIDIFINRYGGNNLECHGMGTTFTGIVFEQNAYLVHVGDSRCYSLDENGKLEQISTDHQDRYGYLTAFVGGGLNFHNYVKKIDAAKRYLLATDGLEELTREEIEECMQLPIEEAADALLNMTLEKGARDNVTFIILDNVNEQ